MRIRDILIFILLEVILIGLDMSLFICAYKIPGIAFKRGALFLIAAWILWEIINNARLFRRIIK